MPTRCGILTTDQLAPIDGCRCTVSNLSIGQIYRYDDPLLGRQFTHADLKRMAEFPHWRGTPKT